MQYTLIIKGKLDSLNDYTKACRSNRYAGAEMKHKNENTVLCAIYEQLGRTRINGKIKMRYKWFEPNTKRDLDNVSSFGRKVIQDALVKAKIITDDGWKNILGFSDEFHVDKKNLRIEVVIEEIEKSCKAG